MIFFRIFRALWLGIKLAVSSAAVQRVVEEQIRKFGDDNK